MTERQMEDLIAEFPDEFFSGRGLVLKGRQQSFAEVGRFGLLFVDSYQTSVLMELKARTAKYEDASQLAEYKDALNQSGQRNILMWLVAPQIPDSVRDFLDRIGIEYSEIHEAHFRRVAERHDVKLDAEETSVPDTAQARHPRSSLNEPRQPRGPRPECPYTLNADFDRNQLDQLLRTFRQIDRSVSDKLRRELLDSSPPFIAAATMGQLAKWCDTKNPLYWDGMGIARKISQLLFGCQLDLSKV